MQKSRLSLALIQRKKTKIISTPPFPHQSERKELFIHVRVCLERDGLIITSLNLQKQGTICK